MATKAIRVGVGQPESPRSGVFRAWTSPKGDVYIAERTLARAFRASLHASGRWRIAFSAEHAAGPSSLVPERDRAILKWQRPPEFAPGFTRAFEIVVPWLALVQYELPYKAKDPIVWLDSPPLGSAQRIFLILANNAAPVTGWPGMRSMGTQFVGLLPAGSDETAWIVAVTSELSKEDRARVEAVSSGRATDRDGRRVESLRALWVGDDEGAGVFWDVPLLG